MTADQSGDYPPSSIKEGLVQRRGRKTQDLSRGQQLNFWNSVNFSEEKSGYGQVGGSFERHGGGTVIGVTMEKTKRMKTS